eukprot:12343737-Alexandrium_andersonii.AAC.1
MDGSTSGQEGRRLASRGTNMSMLVFALPLPGGAPPPGHPEKLLRRARRPVSSSPSDRGLLGWNE